VNRGIDNGSSFLENLTLTVDRGCSTYQTFPYTSNYLLQPDARAHAEAAHYKTLEWKSVDHTVASFKSWLAGGYGIICSFNMWDNFDNYRSGNYNPSGPEGVLRNGIRSRYHGSLIVGYDDNLRCFKVLNSWGETWGEKGFWYFRYEDISRLVSESYIIIPKTKVSPPANVEASKGIYRNKIVISWKKFDEVSDYLVFRLEDDKYHLLGKSSTDHFEDTNALRGKNYFYYVTTYAGNTMSEYSSPVEGWIKEKAEPGIPQNLIAVPLNTAVLLSWDLAEDATHYEIYRWDDMATDFVLIGRSERTLFQDQDLSGGAEQLVAYIITAVNQYGRSLPSGLAYTVLDKNFRGRGGSTFYNERYRGDFYQFPTESFYLIERRVQGYYEQTQSRVESFFSTLENLLNDFFGG
jgi:hypothetical protein